MTLPNRKETALFDHCDLFITTDHGWSFMMASPNGRAAVDLMLDPSPPDWDFGSGSLLNDVFSNAPPDWKAVDINVKRFEQAGNAKLLPRVEGHSKTMDRTTLRIASGAQQTAPDLRIILYDVRQPTGNGYSYFNVKNEDGTIIGFQPPPFDLEALQRRLSEVTLQNSSDFPIAAIRRKDHRYRQTRNCELHQLCVAARWSRRLRGTKVKRHRLA